MAKTDNLLRLMLVEDSIEDAEQVISVLRNAGLAVRPQRADQASGVKELLDTQQLDVVVVSSRAKKCTLAEVVELVSRSGKDIPVLLLVDQITQDGVLKALREGARDIALRSVAEHLQVVVKRELDNLKARRNLRRLEVALRDAEKRAKSLTDSSREPIAYVHEGMHVYANKAYLEMFGIEQFEDIEGSPILDMIAPKDAETFRQVLRQISRGEKPPDRVNLKARQSDGTVFDAVMELSSASVDGEPCTQIIFRQQTVSAELAEQLDALKRQDLVTGLLNRQTFIEELEAAVVDAARGKTDQATLYLEIDNYKQHLDSIGMGAADILLSGIGEELRGGIGEQDIAGRMGEYAFALVLRGRTHDACIEQAQKLIKAISDHIFEAGRASTTITVSAGMCLMTEKMTQSAEVLQRATEACRTAQSAGGNRLEVYDPAATEKANQAELQSWAKAFKEALSKEGFTLVFQPIVSLHGDTSENYEVLLRMQGPQGEVMPGTFFPIAAKLGILAQIDRWVIANVIQLAAGRLREGKKTRFFVKITPEAIEDGSILPWLAQQMKATRVPGELLVFEMPESKVVTNLKPAHTFCRGLEQLRCGFALEQFGSGLNSFQILKHIPATYLKLDRSYMTDLPKNADNQAKLRDLASQAKGLNKLTVAEFVEDAASMAILFNCGVDLVQGNFLHEPMKTLSYEFGL